MITIQAPDVNFVQMTIAVTTSVVADPTPFMTALLRQPASLVRSQ